tara:strand:- start:1317 stop:1994 length:678 start_codon:yes stop_codon:yes gene_type:complete
LKSSQNKFFWVLSFIIIIFSLLGLLYGSIILIGGDEYIEIIENYWQLFRNFLLLNGFWLFVSIAILPGFILPCAPLLLLAGIWGTEFGVAQACLYSVLALTINLIWTYWFAYGPGRKIVNRLLKVFKYEIPELPSQNLNQWAIILRLTPGIPFIFTNYGLGLLKMPFVKYILISTPIISITDCGFVLASAGIFGGSWKYIWGGISILIIMILVGRILSKRKQHAN